MSHLVHLKSDGETTCFSQKTQKEKQLLWNVFWPIACLNLLFFFKKCTGTTSSALFKISLCMNYGQADFKVGQRGAASDHKHFDWQRHILWVMEQHYQAMTNSSALHFIWNATVFINVQLDPVSSSELEPFDQQHFVWQQTGKASPPQRQQI